MATFRISQKILNGKKFYYRKFRKKKHRFFVSTSVRRICNEKWQFQFGKINNLEIIL